MKKRVIVGISGASGVIYGIKLLKFLKDKDTETHLILTESAKINIEIETDYKADDVAELADHVYLNSDLAAPISSGSFLTHAMVVIPCTVKSLSGIVNSFAENLLIRAADVVLKEKRKLVLVVRETPLHKGHLKLMYRAADLGAHILPPVPSFYHGPKSIDDIIDQTIGKIFDYLEIEHDLFKRWSG